MYHVYNNSVSNYTQAVPLAQVNSVTMETAAQIAMAIQRASVMRDMQDSTAIIQVSFTKIRC